MSFLDIYNKGKGAAGATSFTDQAQAMKSALTGKEQAAPVGPAKSQVAEAAATSAAGEEKKNLLQQAQGVQTKFEEQKADVAQTRRLTAQEYVQKKDEVVAQAQRQFDTIHRDFSENLADMDAQKQTAILDQMSFLSSFTDRKFSDNVQREGDRRRLDNAVQMKTAQLYAAFDDHIDLLNKDLEFKKAMEADDRTFQEYLAKLDPAAAIEASLIEYKSKQSQAAGEGMIKGATEKAGTLGETASTFYNKPATPVKIGSAQSLGAQSITTQGMGTV